MVVGSLRSASFFIVDVDLLVLYKGMEGLEPMNIVVQGITAAACIFFMRWFWKVYSQMWRYGGIQSYISRRR